MQKLNSEIQHIVKNDEAQFSEVQTRYAELSYEKEQLSLIYQQENSMRQDLELQVETLTVQMDNANT